LCVANILFADVFPGMPPKKKAEDSDVGSDVARQQLKDLKYKYQFASARYGCEPMHCITKRLDESIQMGQTFDQVQ
jgi:hypothetical protein